MVSVEETQALRRLLEEVQSLKEQLARRDVEHQHALAARDDELAIQRRAVDALGKAIEILHRSGSKTSTETGSAAANERTQSEAHYRQ